MEAYPHERRSGFDRRKESFSAVQVKEMLDISAAITSSLDASEIRRNAVEAATRIIGAERASLLLVEGKGDKLFFEVALGDDQEHFQKVRMVPGEGIAGAVYDSCEGVIINDVQNDPRYSPEMDKKTGFVTRQMVAVPLRCQGRRLGVLEVINSTQGDFLDRDLQLMSALANQISISIENARLHEKLRKSFRETWVYSAILVFMSMATGLYLVWLGR